MSKKSRSEKAGKKGLRKPSRVMPNCKDKAMKEIEEGKRIPAN